MKKIAVIVMALCLVQSTSNSYASGVPAAVVKVARFAARAAISSKDCVTSAMSTAWQRIDNPIILLALSYSAVCFCHYCYKLAHGSEILEKKQKRDLFVASKVLMDLVIGHADGKVGVLGLPEECEQAAQALLVLPGGLEELKKIVGLYNEYFRTQVVVRIVE